MRQWAYDAVDDGWVAHVAHLDEDGLPVATPMLYVRRDDELLLHGAVANSTMRRWVDSTRVSATISLIDGLVVARSAFNSSVAYRSVRIKGSIQSLDGSERDAALDYITDHLIPGRRDEIRGSHSGELRTTTVLALRLDEVELRNGSTEPRDALSDVDPRVWCGVVPIRIEAGAPQAHSSVDASVPVPASVRAWVAPR